MAADKYTAVWVSHTSIGDFLKCPRCYYLKNVYKDPKTNHKIKLMSPPLALGQAVHEVVESLSVLPVEERLKEPLINKFNASWKKIEGKRGGFLDSDTEARYRARGEEMIKRVTQNPGPIARQAVKIKMDLPYYWLSEEENIILCGKIDWLEYLPVTDSVHIIDFKTGKGDENGDSLQLPIYYLLVHNTQRRNVERASYWYLDRNDDLTPCPLPNLEEAEKKVIEIARKIKLARVLDKMSCEDGVCRHCKPYETIIKGKAEFVYDDDFNYDVYILPNPAESEDDSIIL